MSHVRRDTSVMFIEKLTLKRPGIALMLMTMVVICSVIDTQDFLAINNDMQSLVLSEN